MKSGSVRFVVVLLFVLALGAGVAAGLLVSRYVAPAPAQTASSVSTFSDLDLSADQTVQIIVANV